MLAPLYILHPSMVTLLVDPLTSDVYIITKAATGRVYRAPDTIFNTPGTTAALTFMGSLSVALTEPE